MKSKSTKQQLRKKGFFRKAGEVIGSIGHEIAEGKDKVVAASQNIIGSITGAANQEKKAPVKKQVKKVARKKVVGVKKNAVKAVKKSVKKTAKKVAKKTGTDKEKK